MLNKEDRQLLKSQEQEYKQKAKERHEELKRLNTEHKAEVKQSHKENKKSGVAKGSKPKKTPITRTLLDVFPIRDYQDDYFLTDENQIIDVFQIRGKSFYNSSDAEIDAMVEALAYFFRLYKADFKFIGMNYPTNTKNQQAFLTMKQKMPELEKYEELINEKIAALQYLEQNTTDREAFIMIFAKNENHYSTLCNLLNRSGLHIEKISKEKKDNIIFQLNNMNKKVKI